MILINEGVITLKELRASLAKMFDELETIACSTIGRALRRDIRLSKRVVSSRNIRVYKQDRPVSLLQYGRVWHTAKSRGIAVLNIDEAAVFVGHAPSKT